MCWKNLSYIKKGTIIASAYVLYSITMHILILGNLSVRVLNENLFYSLLGILQWPLIVAAFLPIILSGGIQPSQDDGFVALLIGGIILILMGILIGFILDKSRKK